MPPLKSIPRLCRPLRNRNFLTRDIPASRALAAASVLLLGQLAPTHAALLAHEPFTNAPGTAIIGSAGGIGFNSAWQANNSSGTATNTAAGLAYTDSAGNVLSSSGGAGFFQGNPSSSEAMQPIRLFVFSRGTNGADGVTTWISFLVARQGPTGTLEGNPYGRGANVPHDLHAGAQQKLAIGNSSGATSNTVGLIPQGNAANLQGSLQPFGGVTNFVVVRIDHLPAANDRAYLFLNPTLDAEPATAAAAVASVETFDFSFDRLRVFAGGQSSAQQPFAELVVDEYRVGDTFADVTPHHPPPPPPTNGLWITHVALVPGGVVLSGTGGVASAPYHLLATGQATTPIRQWPVVATNQFDDAGCFIITNPFPPAVAAQFFCVRLAEPPPVGPSIVSPPASLVVTQGQNALFSVEAAGTSPLAYQWYFHPNTPLAGATASSLTLNNVQPGDAGGYHVVVTNAAGAVTSAVATLKVEAMPELPDFSLVGFAAVNGVVTGGAGGATQTVSTATAFRNAVGSTSPQVVLVSGLIDLSGSATVRARKTILGLNTNAAILGTLSLSGTSVSNVIIRNLTISSRAGDGITIVNGAHHIWVDHCTFFDCADGQLDITEAADFVTVSWCKFNYTTNSGHNFSMLIGASDDSLGDRGKLKVTLHHNWWSTLAIERMPRVRFGDIHSFNNFFHAPGNNYCIRAALESEILIENNYFLNVDEPWVLQVTAGRTNGLMRAVNNLLVDCTRTNTPAGDDVFIPPYAYTLRPPAEVPGVVTNFAGAGRGPFAP